MSVNLDWRVVFIIFYNPLTILFLFDTVNPKNRVALKFGAHPLIAGEAEGTIETKDKEMVAGVVGLFSPSLSPSSRLHSSSLKSFSGN